MNPQPGRGHSDSLTPRVPGWLLVVLLALVWFYLLALALDVSGWIDQANLWGPLTLGIAALVTGFQLLRREPMAIWTPYAWFLAAIVLYYSLGPLIYPFAGPRTLAYAQSFLPIDHRQVLLSNLLNAVGVLAIFLGFGIARLWSVRLGRSRLTESSKSEIPIHFVAIAFLAVGGVLEYLVILPSQFGAYKITLPGVVNNLSYMYVLGLMVLAYMVAKGKRNWKLPLIILWTIQVVVSLLVFSKQQLLLTMALPAVGTYLAHRKVTRLLGWGAILTVVYFSVGPLVLYGRGQIAMHTGNINQATLGQRSQIVANWFSEGMPSPGAQVSSAGAGWARLDYAPEQSYAMSLHDHGQKGHTLRNILIVLIPRVIWHNKPVTTNIAVDFYQMVTGRRGTHLGLGVFGEGYWDYGWLGTILLAFFTGVAFYILSSFAIRWMQSEAFEYLPSIALGINMGLVGTTAFFVNSVVGGTGFFFVYMGLIWFLKRVFFKQRNRQTGNKTLGRGLVNDE